MGIRDVVQTLASVPTLLKLKRGMVPRDPAEKDCFARAVEVNAETYGDATAVITENEEVSWKELNERANRYAHALKEQGVTRGDTVSVMMENRIEFLVVVTAISKVGAVAGLINTNLTGRPLRHCITVTESKKCLFGAEVADAIGGVVDELELEAGADFLFVADGEDANCPDWAFDFARSTSNQPDSNLPKPETSRSVRRLSTSLRRVRRACRKAAVLSHRRYLMSAGLAGIAGLRLTPTDRIYLCLPLYHGTGLMIGVGSSLGTGASMFLRRKFSASAFLREIREYQCSSLVYIGELCRYLMNTEVKPDDARTPLVKMMGNGLRPDVWMGFKQRFGIERITEFYGSSEGNVAFANLMNKDCTIGTTSTRIALVKYDVDDDEIIRDANGRCIEVAQGEPGLLLGHITPEAVFEGYTDAEATSKRSSRTCSKTATSGSTQATSSARSMSALRSAIRTSSSSTVSATRSDGSPRTCRPTRSARSSTASRRSRSPTSTASKSRVPMDAPAWRPSDSSKARANSIWTRSAATSRVSSRATPGQCSCGYSRKST